MVLAGRTKTQSFHKLFSGGHLFAFVEYLCNRSPKIKTKNIKNYSLILAIVNHWNWLGNLPPLNSKKSNLLVINSKLISPTVKTHLICLLDQFILSTKTNTLIYITWLQTKFF